MRGSHIWALCVAALVAACALLLAGGLRPYLGPPGAQDEVLSIAADLRCPVCAGESVASSSAGVAVQMRQQIAAELQAGESRQQILQGFVNQYGTWILYRPPGTGLLALLWLVPVAALAAVVLTVVRYLRRRAVRSITAGGDPAPAGSEPALRQRLARFL